jgi:hypothetical protein
MAVNPKAPSARRQRFNAATRPKDPKAPKNPKLSQAASRRSRDKNGRFT